MASAIVSPDVQLTIPGSIRTALGLEHGGRVELVEYEQGQYAIVAATASADRLKGMLYKTGVRFTIDEMKVIVRRKVALAAK
jgi:antitoxin PrlF